jgi:hypothetical protein
MIRSTIVHVVFILHAVALTFAIAIVFSGTDPRSRFSYRAKLVLFSADVQSWLVPSPKPHTASSDCRSGCQR